ncbi:MAG: hypothetical protein JKY65_32455 [Planctomycetes bacterium]|nr:hypothetical protein [Planctomycetota bacterium]
MIAASTAAYSLTAGKSVLGTSPENAAEAAKHGVWALDFNSGLESSPGLKSPAQLEALLKALRGEGRQA